MIREILKRSIVPTACCALLALAGCHAGGNDYEEYEDPDGTEAMSGDSGDSGTTTTARPAPRPAARRASGDLTMYYPTGDPSTSAVRIDKNVPGEVSVGESFNYEIMVTNISDLTLSNVVVTDKINDVMDVSRTNPSADSMRAGTGTWTLGTLEPGASKTIVITGTANTVGTITNCASIAFDSVICASINVVKPGLELVKTAPREVMLCDAVPVRFVVRNPGTGVAKNVRISDPLPNGMVTADGKSRIDIQVGDLAPGESKEFTVQCKANRTGSYENTATAAATGNLSAESGTTNTTVRQPELTVACDSPDLRYIGRTAEFEVTVKNEGDGVANNVVLTDTLSGGVEIVGASNNGQVSGSTVRWAIGSLRPGESRDVTITIRSTNPGTFRNTATVSGDCSDNDSCNSQVEYRGIPAILLEVVDITDPVEVGSETTYVITATNQGSAPDTNIKIVCELPDSQRYVSSGGATTGSNRGQTVNFAALGSLGVGQKATWTVTIRATSEADARFRVTMDTDELSSNVEETEATRLYR